MFFRLFLGAPTATKPSWHTSRGLRGVILVLLWLLSGWWNMIFFSHHFGEVEGSLVVGSLAKIGWSSNIFIVVSSGGFDGLLVCWFIGEGCFLLACMVCLPQKFIPMLFFWTTWYPAKCFGFLLGCQRKALFEKSESVGDSWDQYGSTTFLTAGFQAGLERH